MRLTKFSFTDISPLRGVKRKVHRNALIFLAACLIVLGGAFVLTGLQHNYYADRPVDFAALADDEYVLTAAMTNADVSAVKLDGIAGAAAPRIGLYGHHLIRRMGRGAFAAPVDNSHFFNYHFLHATLPETRDLIRMQAEDGTLPTDLLLVYISHPYIRIDMLTGYRWEMPLGFYIRSLAFDEGSLIDKAEFLVEQYTTLLGHRLDWKHIAYALINNVAGSCQLHGVYKVGAPARTQEMPAIIELARRVGLGYLVDKFNRAFSAQCVAKRLIGFRNDGTYFGPIEKTYNPELVPSEQGHWTDAHRQRIEEVVHDIAAIAAAHGRKVVFFIPPRIHKFFPDSGHEILDAAVANLSGEGLVIIDHRLQLWEERYFVDGEHVNNTYFRLLLDEIDKRDMLPPLPAAEAVPPSPVGKP